MGPLHIILFRRGWLNTWDYRWWTLPISKYWLAITSLWLIYLFFLFEGQILFWGLSGLQFFWSRCYGLQRAHSFFHMAGWFGDTPRSSTTAHPTHPLASIGRFIEVQSIDSSFQCVGVHFPFSNSQVIATESMSQHLSMKSLPNIWMWLRHQPDSCCSILAIIASVYSQILHLCNSTLSLPVFPKGRVEALVAWNARKWTDLA